MDYSEGLDPLLIEFDPDLPYDEQTGMNRGCPVGYAAQFVGEGEPVAVTIKPGLAVRCRKIEGVTAADIKRESGTTTSERAGILTGAIADTAQQVGDGIKRAADRFGPIVVLGLVAVIAVNAGRIFGRR